MKFTTSHGPSHGPRQGTRKTLGEDTRAPIARRFVHRLIVGGLALVSLAVPLARPISAEAANNNGASPELPGGGIGNTNGGVPSMVTPKSSAISKDFFAEQVRKLFAESVFDIDGFAYNASGGDPRLFGGVELFFRQALSPSPVQSVAPGVIAGGLGNIYRYIDDLSVDSATAAWSGDGVDLDVVFTSTVPSYASSEKAYRRSNGKDGKTPGSFWAEKDFPYSNDHNYYNLKLHLVPTVPQKGVVTFAVTSLNFEFESNPCVGLATTCSINEIFQARLDQEIEKSLTLLLNDKQTTTMAGWSLDKAYDVIPAAAKGKFDKVTASGPNLLFWYL